MVEMSRKGRAVLWNSEAALQAIYRSGDSNKDRLDAARAERAEIELAQIKGALVPRETVLADLQKRYAAFRGKLLALPSAMAGRFAPPGKLVQVEEVLTVAIHEALSEMAGDGPGPAGA